MKADRSKLHLTSISFSYLFARVSAQLMPCRGLFFKRIIHPSPLSNLDLRFTHNTVLVFLLSRAQPWIPRSASCILLRFRFSSSDLFHLQLVPLFHSFVIRRGPQETKSVVV